MVNLTCLTKWRQAASAKKRILAECGTAVSETPADMAVTLLKAMGKI